jgi:hypothetical protein
MKAIGIVLGILLVLAVAAGISACVAGLAMLLWNYAAVGAFKAPPVTFWQAWALMLLLGFISGAVRVSKSRKK